MPWPTIDVVTTAMDQDTDTIPRGEILLMAQNVNSIRAMRNVADGICPLDSSAKVPAANLPSMNYLPLAGGTMTGTGIFPCAAGSIANAAGSLAKLEVKGVGGASDAAYMTFHRPGYYAAYFGLGADNTFKYGGWTFGAVNYTVWSTQNFDPNTKANLASPTFTGTVTVADLWISSAANYIRFTDTSNGQNRHIHHNEGYIGFLTSGGGWNFALNDDGSVLGGTPFANWLGNNYAGKNTNWDWTQVLSSYTAPTVNIIGNWGHGIYIVEVVGLGRTILGTTGNGAYCMMAIGTAISGDGVTNGGSNMVWNVWKLRKA